MYSFCNFFSFLWVNLSLVTSYTLQVTLHILNRVVHKATALVQHVQPNSMNTLLLILLLSPKPCLLHLLRRQVSKLGTAFVPAPESCFMFSTAGRWLLNWSLDTNICNLPAQTNITHTVSLPLQPPNSDSGCLCPPYERTLVSSHRWKICCRDKNMHIVHVQKHTERKFE